MNQPTCLVCGEKSTFLMFKEEYPLYKCQGCDLVFLFPQPTTDFLAREVYSLESGYQANKPSNLAAVRPTTKQKQILDFFKTRSRGTVLDIGCSNGQMMFWLKQLDFQVKGVELNQRTAAIARLNGLEVFDGMVNDSPYSPASFDYILLGDIIEHITDPRKFLIKCHELLAPGGMILILTPNLDCWWSQSTFKLWQWFGVPWSSVTPPHHLFQFSTGNLTRLLKETNFSVNSLWYTKPPALKYELGSLHLVRQYRKNKNIKNIFLLIGGFSFYVVLYSLNELADPWLKRNNGLVVSAVKNHNA